MDFKEDLSHGYAGKKQAGIVWGREGQREGERAVAAPGATVCPAGWPELVLGDRGHEGTRGGSSLAAWQAGLIASVLVEFGQDGRYPVSLELCGSTENAWVLDVRAQNTAETSGKTCAVQSSAKQDFLNKTSKELGFFPLTPVPAVLPVPAPQKWARAHSPSSSPRGGVHLPSLCRGAIPDLQRCSANMSPALLGNPCPREGLRGWALGPAQPLGTVLPASRTRATTLAVLPKSVCEHAASAPVTGCLFISVFPEKGY